MTFYFYDLETSGLSSKWQRIMQFAGQRTDQDLNPIGKPDNWLVKLTPEILPDPEAILVTGITPQKSLDEGITESEMLKHLFRTVFTPDTVVMGFNSLRFDDEFVRTLLYRNFYDAYEREWKDNRGRWDIVDLVRMTRALRPEGIKWPVTDDGKPTNRLELLTVANGIKHDDAHDALADVRATIEVARLIKSKQSKLYNHLLNIRHKKQVIEFLNKNEGLPIVHSSSKYHSDTLSTSVIAVLGPTPGNKNSILVYDLRQSPSNFFGKSSKQLAKLVFTSSAELAEQGNIRLPVKEIHLNKSPALAPIGVLDKESQKRIKLSTKQIETNFKELSSNRDFAKSVQQIWQDREFQPETDVDAMLYEGFINNGDKKIMEQVRNHDVNDLADWHPIFSDPRLTELLLRYKARNFPKALSDDESIAWEQYRSKRLSGSCGPDGVKAYMSKLTKLSAQTTDKDKLFLLNELKLYAESILPYENESLSLQ